MIDHALSYYRKANKSTPKDSTYFYRYNYQCNHTMYANESRINGDDVFILLTDRYKNTVAEAIVSSVDSDRILSHGRWRLGSGGYVYTCCKHPVTGHREDVALHRLVMNTPSDMVVDHINHDPLDNRRCNLRVLTKAENMQNRRGPVAGKLDPFRNVYRQSKGNGYVVRVSGKYFGAYPTLEEADLAAQQARRQVMQYSTN